MMNIIERKLQAYKFERQVNAARHLGSPQPPKPLANVIISSLTSAGISANGKGSKEFLPPFCRELRRHGYATYLCTSVRQIERILTKVEETIIINVFGEDHHSIASPAMISAEAKTSIVFNRSEIGVIIADKQVSLEHFTKFGVPMPPPPTADSLVFSNKRLGTGLAVEVIQNLNLADQNRYNRAMINTVQAFEGKSYYTSVRLMCIADRIFHAVVRARPVEDNSPSVTGTNTPLNPALLRHLQTELIDNRLDALNKIARKMYDAIGPCFAAHDILIEANSENIFVNETGFKFSVGAFRRHLHPIREEVPFLDPMFDPETYAQNAAHVFVDWVRSEKFGASATKRLPL